MVDDGGAVFYADAVGYFASGPGAAVAFAVGFAAYSEVLPQGAAVAFVLAEVAVNGAVVERDLVVFAQVGAYLFGTEFAADKGVDVLNQLRIELIGFSLTLFGQPALPLGFSALYCCPWVRCRLISRLMVLLCRLSCLVISAMVQWRDRYWMWYRSSWVGCV